MTAEAKEAKGRAQGCLDCRDGTRHQDRTRRRWRPLVLKRLQQWEAEMMDELSDLHEARRFWPWWNHEEQNYKRQCALALRWIWMITCVKDQPERSDAT